MTTASTSSPSTPAVRALDELLCFDLYAASRAVTARYRPLLEELSLTYPQYLVLVVLRADEPLTVTDVGAALHLDHGTLTPLLRRLAAAGLVTRRRSTDDERRVEVTLTEAGERLRAGFEDVQCAVVESMGLGGDDARALQQTLRTLTRALRGRELPRDVSDR